MDQLPIRRLPPQQTNTFIRELLSLEQSGMVLIFHVWESRGLVAIGIKGIFVPKDGKSRIDHAGFSTFFRYRSKGNCKKHHPESLTIVLRRFTQYLMTKGTRITPPTQAWWLGKDPIKTKEIIEGRGSYLRP